MKPKNPFVLIGYPGPEYFCARELVYRSESGYLVYERLFAEWLRSPAVRCRLRPRA